MSLDSLLRFGSVCAKAIVASLALATGLAGPISAQPTLDPREVHLAGLEQLTFGGENAEAYWAPDGKELILQSTHPPYACDQIFRLPIDSPGTMSLVSTGKGRTTCSYFTYPKGERILYASTHAAGDDCPPPPDRSKGYVWPILGTLEIWSALPDGSDLKRLTDNSAYDAEATVCPQDGAIVFTSTRDGDLELYRMDPDGGNVKRLTDTPGLRRRRLLLAGLQSARVARLAAQVRHRARRLSRAPRPGAGAAVKARPLGGRRRRHQRAAGDVLRRRLLRAVLFP